MTFVSKKVANIVLRLFSVSGLTLVLLAFSSQAQAFPEFVRHGYFSCTSCHVSPSGGGILTDYGRSYAAEKLAASSVKGEEEALHGALPGEAGQGVRSWLLFGGNIRQVQTASENPGSRDGRWIPMQRDLEICVVQGVATACATGGITKHTMMSQSGKAEYGLRKYSAQIQAGESLLVRAGRFSPRFGVMTPDHNIWVQSLSGRGIDDERDQLELVYSAEKLEVAIARDQGRNDDRNLAKGYIANAMTAVTEMIRAGFSYRISNSDSTKSQTAGIFTAAGIDEKTYVLAEINRQSVAPSSPGASNAIRVASYVKAGRELRQGLVGYAVQQVDLKEGSLSSSRRDMYGLGLQYFPRPHIEVDAMAGKVLSRSNFTYLNTAYVLFHYYL